MCQEKNREKECVKTKQKNKKQKKIVGDEVKIKNKRGQALVEFAIILPIFVFILFACIDLGKIFYIKNNLESRLDDCIAAYQEKKEIETIKKDLDLTKEKIDLTITKEEDYLELKLQKKTDLITPGLNVLLGNPYLAEAKRVIYNE